MLDGGHGVVDELADGGLAGSGLDVGPAGLGWNPEDVDRAVLVGVFEVGTLRTFSFELCVLFLEGVRDVLKEDETKDDVLVLCSVHRAAQGIGHLPKLGFVAEIGR